MRQRNTYGLAGNAKLGTSHRTIQGQPRPVTARGRRALENSRRRLPPR